MRLRMMSKIPVTSQNSHQHNPGKLPIIAAWSLSLAVCLAAVVAWGMNYSWHILPFRIYQVFPLLGLLAFSIMWSHYISAAFRDIAGINKKLFSRYFRLTGYAVLILICLHPGLLIYQRFRDGFGLPPGSYESYVAPGLGWVTILGTASLGVFLAFEFHRKFGNRTWWHYVQDASDPAMLAILYHGLRLGSQLQQGWFRYIWLFYTVTLIAVLIRKYIKRVRHYLADS